MHCLRDTSSFQLISIRFMYVFSSVQFCVDEVEYLVPVLWLLAFVPCFCLLFVRFSVSCVILVTHRSSHCPAQEYDAITSYPDDSENDDNRDHNEMKCINPTDRKSVFLTARTTTTKSVTLHRGLVYFSTLSRKSSAPAD